VCVCVCADAFKKHERSADRAVGPGALPRHQLGRFGDKGSEGRREGRKGGERFENHNISAPF